jgi:hypothetical protein
MTIDRGRRPHLSLRTPRSGAFVASFVPSFVDKAPDKARDKVLRHLKNLSLLTGPALNPDLVEVRGLEPRTR